jgi:hypothetical protein
MASTHGPEHASGQEGDATSQACGALQSQTRGLGQVPVYRFAGSIRVHQIHDPELAASSSYMSAH